MRLLVVASLVAGCVDDPRSLPPPRQLTPHERVAVARLDAHDAAVQRNADAKKACDLWHHYRPDTFGILYGDAPATPGAAFASERNALFRIRKDTDEWTAIVADGTQPGCDPKDDAETFCPFQCTDDVGMDYIDLSWSLRQAWGESPTDTWLDRTGTVRATLREDTDCTLRFQRYVPPRAWIAMNETAEVPLALIGESVKRLPSDAYATYSIEYDVDRYERDLPVTGEHILHAELFAMVHAGRIIGLEVDGKCDEDGGADELHELVRPLRDRVHLRLHTNGDRFELVISE